MKAANPHISDEEITADLFRLARSGRFKRLAPLLKEAEELYPNEPSVRIKECMKRLGEILWEADYQGCRREFHLHRRPKAQGLLRQSTPHLLVAE